MFILRHLHKHLFQVERRTVEIDHRRVRAQRPQKRRSLRVPAIERNGQVVFGFLAHARHARLLADERDGALHGFRVRVGRQADGYGRVAVHVLVQRFHRAGEDELSVIDNRQRVAHFGQLRQNMRGNEHSLSQFLERTQDVFHFRACARIHPGSRLVEDEQLRVVNERPRETEPLLHSAREHVHIAVPLFAQVHQFQQVVDHVHPFSMAKAVAAGIEVKVFPCLQPVVHAEKVRHVAHQAVHLLRVVHHIHTVERGRAGGGLEQRGKDAHRRRLSRAVRADEAVQLAVADGHIEMIKRGKRAVGARQFVCYQHH